MKITLNHIPVEATKSSAQIVRDNTIEVLKKGLSKDIKKVGLLCTAKALPKFDILPISEHRIFEIISCYLNST